MRLTEMSTLASNPCDIRVLVGPEGLMEGTFSAYLRGGLDNSHLYLSRWFPSLRKAEAAGIRVIRVGEEDAGAK